MGVRIEPDEHVFSGQIEVNEMKCNVCDESFYEVETAKYTGIGECPHCKADFEDNEPSNLRVKKVVQPVLCAITGEFKFKNVR